MRTFWVKLSMVVCCLIVVAGCSATQSNIPSAPPYTGKTDPPKSYLIQAGDELDIKFFYNPELNERVTVRPDGMISLQLVDEVRASGLKPSELNQKLTELYSKELRKPKVTVIVRTFNAQRVYVGGEVTREGLLTLPAGMTALQAVFQAGGFRDTAQPSETLVIRKGEDNRPVPMLVDLSKAYEGDPSNGDVTLHPDDIVYVPKSAIAKANQFVDQYIEKLLLFRGVSLGFTYELHADNPN
jgi:protein involved in polysaccharide export with SLBB domain